MCSYVYVCAKGYIRVCLCVCKIIFLFEDKAVYSFSVCMGVYVLVRHFNCCYVHKKLFKNAYVC